MKRFQQPQTVTGLAPGYKDAIVAVEYGTRRNQGSAVTTRAGVGSISVSSSGLYRTGYDGGSNVAADVFTGAPTSGFTIVCVYDLATSSGSYVPIVGGDQPSNRQFQLRVTPSGTIEFIRFNTSEANYSVTTSTTGRIGVVVAVSDGGSFRLIHNGTVTSSGTIVGTPKPVTVIAPAGYLGFDASPQSGDLGVSMCVLLPRALSNAEGIELSRNPWQTFRAANSPIFVPVSGGGGSPYTLTADAGAIAITGNAAGLSVNRTLTADAGALSITGNAATLAFNRALIADTANVAITGNAASLVFTPVGGPTYTLPADSAAVAISGASTSLVRGYNLTASAGAVSISASDAALIATRKLIADAYAAVIAGADATLTYTPITYPTIGRPASDTSNSGWTASTGTDLFAMVDEVTPDALDYIVTTATGSVCELALDTTAYPGTASQILKYRASSSTGNSLIVRLKNGATTIRTETQALTASDTEYTITLTSGEIAAITSGSLSVELESA